MKPATQWREELSSVTLNQRVTTASIKRIQADALAAAAEICLEVAQRRVNNDATDCARAIIAEAEKLNP